MLTRRQYVTRHNGKYDVVVDISVPAVKAAMDACGVADQGDCLVKVQRLFHHFLGGLNDASEQLEPAEV